MPENINWTDERILTAFVSEMIARKTPEGLSNQERDKILRVLLGQLNEWVEHALIAALPDEKLAELNALLDDGGDDASIDLVFDKSGIDFDEVTRRALEEFRNNYLEKGDNIALIAKADEMIERFEREVPVGQGHSPELDAVYAAAAAEGEVDPVAVEVNSNNMAMAGER